MKIASLLLLFALGSGALAQDAANGPDGLPKTLTKQEQVENNLIPRSKYNERRYEIRHRMAFYKVPGVSIAVLDGGKIDWAAGYGTTEADKFGPVGVDTPFQVGALSQPVAAMGLLFLSQDRRIGLDEDVNKRLTSWQVPPHESGKTVTLRQLLSHSSGISTPPLGGFVTGKPIPTFTEWLKAANLKAEKEPGKDLTDPDGGYAVAQQIAEDLSGQPFADWMKTNVLDLLEMENSSFDQNLDAERAGRVAFGHTENGELLPGRWRAFPDAANAGLWTTPTDLAQFVIEIGKSMSGKTNLVLSKTYVGEMVKPQNKEFGMGFYIVRGSLRQAGETPGFRSSMVVTADGKGAIVMANSDGGDKLVDEIMADIAEVYGWEW